MSNRFAPRLLLSLPLLVLWCSGCAAFRAEIGFGLGGGVTVSVPAILHTGLGGGQFYHLGHHYSDGWRAGDTGGLAESPDGNACDWDLELALVFVHMSEVRDRIVVGGQGSEPVPYYTYRPSEHFCVFCLPAVLEPNHASSYALEVSAGLIFFEIRLGFCPWYFFRDEHWAIEGAPSGLPSESVMAEVNALLTQGEQGIKERKLNEAVEAYDRAIRLIPECGPAYVGKGAALTRLARPQEAFDAIDKGITLAVKSEIFAKPAQQWLAAAYREKGLALTALARPQEAIAAFTHALESSPDPILYVDRASIYANDGKSDKALEDLDKAIAADAECTHAYMLRSLLYATGGDREKALADYRKVEELMAGPRVSADPARFAEYVKRLKALGVVPPE